MDPTIGLFFLAALLVAIGLAGTLLPAIPGTTLIFAGLLLAAWVEDFAYVGTWTLAVIGGLTALTYAVDFVAGSLGARRFGASPRAVYGAAIGAVVGLFFGLPGILLGPLVGAVLGELSARRTLGEAGRAGIGTALGLAIGTAAKLALALSMVGVFAFVRFFPDQC
jgi:uncharacterized protein YqgC (DUF456 family)